MFDAPFSASATMPRSLRRLAARTARRRVTSDAGSVSTAMDSAARGPRPLMAGGTAMAAVGMALFTQISVHSGYLSHVLPAEIVMSLGMGFAFVALSSTALVGVDERDAGVASALVNTTQQVGGSLGTALLNTIAASATVHYVAGHGAGSLGVATVHGYTVAFTWGLGALILAAALALLLLTKQRPAAAGDSATDVDETSFERAEELGSIL